MYQQIHFIINLKVNKIEEGDFSLNLAYCSKSKKIKVSTIQKKETVKYYETIII